MQKEADDALVFAEKEHLLTETSTAELSERGLRIKGYQCNIAPRWPLWKPLKNAIQRLLSVYDSHFLGSYNPSHSRSLNSSVVTTTYGTLIATLTSLSTTTLPTTFSTTISTTTMYDIEYNDDRSLLKH